MAKLQLSSWGLGTAARVSTWLRRSILNQRAGPRRGCSPPFPREFLLLNNVYESTALCSPMLQQMRCTAVTPKADGAAEPAGTDCKRPPPNYKTLVKQLRDRTSVSMGLCKRALEESNWDEEEAVVYLRKCGIARAEKNTGREAREGVVAVCRSVDGTQCTAVMLNCETDFVQKNAKFVAVSQALAEHCCSTLRCTGTSSSDTPENALLTQLKSSQPSRNLSSCVQRVSTASASSVSELIAELTTQFGEKIELSSVYCIDSDASSCIGVYVHNEVSPGMGVGSAAAIVELRWTLSSPSAAPTATLHERLSKFARLLAMQVLATCPKFVDVDSMPSSVVEEERAISEGVTAAAATAAATKSAAAEDAGTTAAEIESAVTLKTAAQRMQRCLEDQCLLPQEFLMMNQLFQDVLPDAQPEAGQAETDSGGGGSRSSKTHNQVQNPPTVADALRLVGQTLGCTLTVTRMRRLFVGSQ